MNLHNTVSTKMDLIQKIFLDVETLSENIPDTDELISFLNDLPPEFRSVAYESASMIIARRDLNRGIELNNWKKMYYQSANEHTFHIDIGLGWAYAKNETLPKPFPEILHPAMKRMVFDGIGYYNGLFKGRRTVKNQWVPEELDTEELEGFDQGLGRRLWYNVKGDVREVTALIQQFILSRHPALWSGVGIACGYVGGNMQSDLELLLVSSGKCRKQLQTGVMFAAISRIASGTVTTDVENACMVICQKTIQEIEDLKTQVNDKLFYLYKDTHQSSWFNLLESELHQLKPNNDQIITNSKTLSS